MYPMIDGNANGKSWRGSFCKAPACAPMGRSKPLAWPMGAQDDAVWTAHLAKPAAMQDMAHRRVAVVAHVVKHRAQGLTWSRIAAALPAALGKCPDEKTVER